MVASGKKAGQMVPSANIAESYCYKLDHICNKYTKKNECNIKGPSEGHMCAFTGKVPGFKCQPRLSYACGDFKKSKECKAWEDFGCSFIKKKSQKPASLKNVKCVDINSDTYLDWVAAGGSKSSGSVSSSGPVDCGSLNETKCDKNRNCAWDPTDGVCLGSA